MPLDKLLNWEPNLYTLQHLQQFNSDKYDRMMNSFFAENTMVINNSLLDEFTNISNPIKNLALVDLINLRTWRDAIAKVNIYKQIYTDRLKLKINEDMGDYGHNLNRIMEGEGTGKVHEYKNRMKRQLEIEIKKIKELDPLNWGPELNRRGKNKLKDLENKLSAIEASMYDEKTVYSRTFQELRKEKMDGIKKEKI